MDQPPSEPRRTPPSPELLELRRRFWQGNVRIMLLLLAAWAIAGLGCGVLFADALNAFSWGGFPLGFWFAQQGSIILFVVIILIFCVVMNRRDREHRVELDQLKAKEGGGR